ncbi:4-hydroxy-3-methylbut-2-enyl diphosphate reductase [Ignavibacteria bacterium]|nr:4-hydroxy-3-methylbut-2-enyl diphosphate reductase [Bacteroidota bacterium]MCZ2132294.1 4-hydroxy-3-methylbut-2-enyl diphosphate reductase [Bacteroidota bacterium]
MQVVIDKFSGFCWGVVRTIQIAEETLAENNGNVYVLGNIIHNPKEIARLEAKGLQTISRDDLDNLFPDAKVLVRAHGEPPETYRRAFARGIEIIDATCPIVSKLQERVRKFYDSGFQVVIFGKKEHAEVVGVRGVCNDECIIVKNVGDALKNVDFSRPTVLFSQTTMDRAGFFMIRQALHERINDLIVEPAEFGSEKFQAKDTICGQVSGREEHLARFAADNDVVIFAAGKASSNGKVLYEVCRAANPRTYFIEDVEELRKEWFDGAETVGVSGATSTPQWYMEIVKSAVESGKFGECRTSAQTLNQSL